MRVYEAIVKALESVGVDAAFGGAGENAAGAMIALKHSTKIRPVIVRHEQADRRDIESVATGAAKMLRASALTGALATGDAFINAAVTAGQL